MSPRVLIVAGVGLLLAIVSTLVAIFYDFTAAIAIPFALAAIYATLRWPFGAYLTLLAMVSIVPVEGRLLGFYVPYWTQLFIPAVFIGALLPRLFARDEQRLTGHWADLAVLGFIVLGYAGVIGAQEGLGQYKWFTNEVVMPASLYFVARWLPYDRMAFRLQLRWQLLAAGLLMADMALAPLLGRELLYGGGFAGFGVKAVGVAGTASDIVSYAPLWFPLFLYAAVTALPGLGRSRAIRFWLVLAITCVIATLATTERTGALAIFLAALICLAHVRFRRYVIWGMLAMVVIIPLWLTTSIGSTTLGRLQRLNNEGEGFERRVYRDKAWAVINSANWNPLYGTGFGGLRARSALMVSETEEIFDYNWGEWRPATVYKNRAIHCAPLSLFGEYGYGGIFLLLTVTAFVVRSFLQAYRQARAQNMAFDSTFLVAAIAALATIGANGMYHNTDSVIEVIIVMWSFAGLIIGHPEVFVIRPEDSSVQVEMAHTHKGNTNSLF